MEITALSNYKLLLQKVDQKFAQILEKYPQDFKCQKGCYSCCKKDLTVSQIEAENIKDHLKNPQVLEKISLDKGQKAYCDFLSEDGACLIYEARPIICRSHGAPIRWKESENSEQRDVCYLNFTTQKLEDLSDQDFFQIDTLNTILTALNKQAGFNEVRVPLKRVQFLEKFTNI